VEAVLEDFEKRNADNEDKSAVEEKRRYLGGDSDHSILVKGLDMALLEQNKMRASGLSAEDDDSLEQAFQDISSHAAVPRKRTRDDLIRELKEKRAQKDGIVSDAVATTTAVEEALLLEAAKKKGKFKPIGFKPVGSPDETAKKKNKVKVDVNGRETKKKRRKVTEDREAKDTSMKENPTPLTAIVKEPSPQPSPSAPLLPDPEPEPEPADVDIFAGAGDYTGIELGDEEEDGEEQKPPSERNEALNQTEESSTVVVLRRWIETEEPEPTSEKQEALPSTLELYPPPTQAEERDHEGEGHEQLTQLVPLASSALPSIKDFLAMDKAAGGHGKRKKRKGGKQEDGKVGNADSKKKATEAKVERDYKRLVIYSSFFPFHQTHSTTG
jgi:IK cytokine